MANEAQNCERFVREVMDLCSSYAFRELNFLAVFDNACTDGSYDMVRNLAGRLPGLDVIFAPENRCVVDAYLRGYREALDRGCDWILEMDAGYSHRPSDIPLFFNAMMKGYDCVFGSRFSSGGHYKNSVGMRYFLSRGGTMLTNALLGTRLSDMTSGFEIFTHSALDEILRRGITSRGPFFQTEIKAYAHGYKISEVPIQYNATGQTTKSRYILDSMRCLWNLYLRRKHPA